MSPTPHPENIPRDVACVINTHLDFDHCGGNRLFPGVPIHVQARELADARSLDDYTIREWFDFDGATYVEHEGEGEVLPGRLLPAPGHTDGHQVVVVETSEGLVVLGGDVGTSFDELNSGTTEGQRRVLALGRPTRPAGAGSGASASTSHAAPFLPALRRAHARGRRAARDGVARGKLLEQRARARLGHALDGLVALPDVQRSRVGERLPVDRVQLGPNARRRGAGGSSPGPLALDEEARHERGPRLREPRGERANPRLGDHGVLVLADYVLERLAQPAVVGRGDLVQRGDAVQW
jgi:hypothetical protein